MKLKVLDLFSGIGGFSLGLERSGGFETVAFCEIEPYCRKVLARHWPEVPCYDDIRTLTADTLQRDGITVDAICGGFPCQPFSTASHGRKTATDLWPAMLRVVDDIGPKYVIGENVSEKAISIAASDLRSRGYRTNYRCISANDCGADHQRDRWWIVAHSHDESEFYGTFNAEMAFLPKLCKGLWGAANYARTIGVSDGLPSRVDRLRALGNAVVPQIPEIIGRAIMEAMQ